MIIDCISDLHGHYPQLEGGDLLIVAGDLTARDTEYQHDDFFVWLNDQKYEKKIFIGGNHDNYLQKNNDKFIKTLKNSDLEYLCDSGIEFEGLKIWGSPWTAYFKGMNPNCMAFTINVGCDTDQWLAEKWALIPDEIDILITHSPPWQILDQVQDYAAGRIRNCGSKSLRDALDCIRPRYHIFGHIHENGGRILNLKYSWEGYKNKTSFINASHVNERYEPVNKPIRIEL